MEKAEIESLLVEMQPELMRYACHLTKDMNRANDLLQETNLRIIVNHEKFDGSKFRGWSFRIMLRTFINNSKREERFSLSENMENICDGKHHPFVSFYDDSLCNVKDIYRTLSVLPAEHCCIIRLLVKGYMYKEIAARRKLPIGSVKNKIFKSRAVLEVLLKDFEI